MSQELSITFKVDYAHRLANHPGKCNNIHGHTGKVILTLEGSVHGYTGMIADFGDIKGSIVYFIEDLFDHTLILNEEDPYLPIFKRSIPTCKLYVLKGEPTAENLSREIFNLATDLVYDRMHKRDLRVVSVEFFETETCSAKYSGE